MKGMKGEGIQMMSRHYGGAQRQDKASEDHTPKIKFLTKWSNIM